MNDTYYILNELRLSIVVNDVYDEVNELEIPLSLATKLQALRRKSGESLQQVADGVGVSKGHVWALEKGTAENPSLDLVRKLADHFKVTIAYLNDEVAEPTDAAALQFFREFDGKLTDRDWDILRNLAKNLKTP